MAGLGGGYNPGGGGNRGVNYHAQPVQQMSIDGRPLILNQQGNALVANPAQPHRMNPYEVGSRTYPDWHPLAVARRDFEPNQWQEIPPPVPGGASTYLSGNCRGNMHGSRTYSAYTRRDWEHARGLYEARMDVTRRERRQRRALRHRMARFIQAYYRNYKDRTDSVIDLTGS